MGTKMNHILYNNTKKIEISNKVSLAKNFWDRTRGLMGRPSMPLDEVLWIQGSPLISCNSIHTFFMRFSIDAIFVDKSLVVKKIYRDLSPWQMTWPAKKATSVFEFKAGAIDHKFIEIGDQLHVGG